MRLNINNRFHHLKEGKMKLRTLTAVLLVVMLCWSWGALQAGTRVYGGVGYGLGVPGLLYDVSEEMDLDLYYDEVTDVTDHYLNFGKGIKFGGGIEVPIKPHLNLRLGGNFWKSTLEATTTGDGSGTDSFYGYTVNWSAEIDETRTYTASLWNIDAVLLVNAKVDNYTVYGGAGAGYFNAKMVSEAESSMEVSASLMGYSESTEETMKMAFDSMFKSSIGFLGVFGVEIPLNDKASFFAEINVQAVSFEIEKEELTDYEVKEDGLVVIDIDDFDDDEKEIEYEKDDPDETPPWTMPGSNATVRGGIKFSIN